MIFIFNQRSYVFVATARAMWTITSIFGSAAQNITDVLLQLITAEHDLLIYGLVNGQPPKDIVNFNGQVIPSNLYVIY